MIATNLLTGHQQVPMRSARGNGGMGRRELLAATAAAGAVGLAGCLGGDGAVGEPVIGSDRIDEWELLDSTEGLAFAADAGPITFEAHQHTVLYERSDVAAALSETFGTDASAVLFFASRIDLRPGVDRLPFGIARDRIVSEVVSSADETFRSELRESGLEDVRHEETGSIDIESGHTATRLRYSARVEMDGEVERPENSTESLTGTVVLEAQLAVWHDGENVLVAGAAYPTERITDTFEATGIPGDSEELLENDALATDPEEFAEEAETLLVSVA